MADLIISQPMTFTVDVKNGLVERPQRESLMRGDRMANRIIAELVDGSEPFNITGVTVKGKFCRPPNGDEIDLAGEAKGNVAEVQLTDQCYTSGGHYEARVILVLGGVERTVLFISGDVLKSGSGNAAGDEETGGSGGGTGSGGTGSGLPAGGTAGQVLVKVSSAQGDAIWKTLTAADVGAQPKGDYALKSEIPAAYTLPTATADALGGVKSSEAVTVNSDGTMTVKQLNGKDAKYYIQPIELLDNPEFAIAQAGYMGQHGSEYYAADRWISESADVSVTRSGEVTTIQNNGSSSAVVIQKASSEKHSLYVGKPITLAICLDDDTILCKSDTMPTIPESSGVHACWLDLPNGTLMVNIFSASVNSYQFARFIIHSGASVSFKWIRLIPGTYTADNLPPYIPKGYAAELAECQRYFLKLSGGGIIGVAHAYESDGAYAFVPTPVVMRKAPSIAYESMSIGTSGYADNFANVTGWANNALTGNGVRFFVTSSNLTSGEIYCLTANNLTFYADL